MIKYKISKNKNVNRQQTLQMLAARQKKKRKKETVPQSGGIVPLRQE
jgi:hypothetical protein